MRVCLAMVRERTFRWEETRKVSGEELSLPDHVKIGPVAWNGDIRYVQPDYLLTASLAYDQTLVCDRCLKAARDCVDEEVQLLLVTVDEPGSDEEQLETQELARVVVSDDEVDLNPLLYEQIQLHVPMKPLCRTECAGLCSQCGADLNDGSCSCQTEEGDPRWTALRALKERLPEA